MIKTIPAYTMDPTTNISATAFVGAQVWGAAYDPVNNIVYFNSGSTLYEWPVGGAINILGTIEDGTGAGQSIVGLAFHDGQLYGTKNIANEAIYSIDTSTLIATVFIDFVDADLDCGGCVADPATGTFYCTNDDDAPLGKRLVHHQLGWHGNLRGCVPIWAGRHRWFGRYGGAFVKQGFVRDRCCWRIQ